MRRPPDHAPSDRPVGRVLRGDARVYHVELDGEVVQAAPRGRLFEELGDVRTPVTVGDWVVLTESGDPLGIEEVLPRRNQLSKVSSSHDPREQVLFANVDQLVIVGSLYKPGFSSNRTDRILAAAHHAEIPCVLVLNKVDLDRPKDGEVSEYETISETYRTAGYPVIGTSASKELGLEELKETLKGRTSVLYGASGVGKSTLLNALFGLELKVGKISKYWSAGKHTTTHSRLIDIDGETEVVDTPGIRVFRPYGVTKADLRFLFPEFLPFQQRCHFPDYSHDHEPDCAVADAVEDGALATSRYLSYVEILDELEPPPEDVPTVDGSAEEV